MEDNAIQNIRLSPVLVILTLCTLAFISYSNTFNFPFVFDDRIHIPENQHIRIKDLTFQSFFEVLKSPAPNRPIANLSFAFNYYLHGYETLGYHLLNILIHIVSATLIFYIARETLKLIKIKGDLIPFLSR